MMKKQTGFSMRNKDFRLPQEVTTQAGNGQPLPVLLGLPVLDVRRLLGDQREAILTLDGEAYRLRVTAQNKLILTK